MVPPSPGIPRGFGLAGHCTRSVGRRNPRTAVRCTTFSPREYPILRGTYPNFSRGSFRSSRGASVGAVRVALLPAILCAIVLLPAGCGGGGDGAGEPDRGGGPTEQAPVLGS